MGRLVVVACLFVILIPIAIASARRDLRRCVHNPVEVQNLLKRLNKPAVKSIQSPDGDIVDCVLIHQQPAFDHPLLKDHVIQMKPSSEPKGRSEELKSVVQLWQTTNETCPDGTVPIRRTKEEDLLRAHSLEDFGKKKFTRNSSSSSHNRRPFAMEDPSKHEYAIGVTGEGKYYGAKANINIWSPLVEQPDEFSLAQLWITAGGFKEKNLNSIEFGWQIYPAMYGDSRPRIFIYWTNNAYESTGCYNVKCPGFVQVSKTIVVGSSVVDPQSKYNGDQQALEFQVWKDEKDKKWWVKLEEEVVGYWPTEVLTLLGNGAAKSVQFGGEIVNIKYNGHTGTDMGSGHFPDEGYGRAAFFKNIHIFDSDFNPRPPRTLFEIAPRPSCYNIRTFYNSDPFLGSHFYYGGPGKNQKCP